MHRIQDTGYRIHQGQILNIGYRIQEPGNTRDIDTEYRIQDTETRIHQGHGWILNIGYRIQEPGYTTDVY